MKPFGRNQKLAMWVLGITGGCTFTLTILCILRHGEGIDALKAWTEFARVAAPASLLAILAPSAYAKRGQAQP